tara:strand:+ start:29 stop:517 length:489 start_codon:yes stop_codon:yes gene_type:complete
LGCKTHVKTKQIDNGGVMSDAIKHIMATIFAAQSALRDLAPEYKWAGMGNLLGDYGEYVCMQRYDLKKAPGGSEGFDATTADGKTVQIKTNYASSSIGFRGEADLLLVVQINDQGDCSELYYGDFQTVKDKCSYSARDNKNSITISKLKKISENQKKSIGKA